MSRVPLKLLGLLLALGVAGCEDRGFSESDDRNSVPLSRGGFIAWTGSADLSGSPTLPVENRGLWLPQPVVAEVGWGPPGRGWHPVGDRSKLRWWRRTAGGFSFGIDLVHRQEVPVASYRVGVRVNDRDLGSLATRPGRVHQRFALPPGLVAEQNRLELTFEPAIELTEGRPPLSLLRVGFGGGAKKVTGPKDRSRVRPDDTAAVVIDTSGAFVLPVAVSPSVSILEIRAQNRGRVPVWHRLSVERADGERIDLLSGRLPDRDEWRQRSAIDELRGERVTLVWELELAAGEGRVELSEIALVGAGEPVEPQGSAIGPRRAVPRRPDVLLIILDAARGDRFPGWDYPRQTMPIIEELSREALTFRHAFAECPTTSCSIPAMITGVPFLPAGQVGQGSQLSDEVTTLAEYLAELGYRTVAFSATPNNSASHNLDQGFAVFRELWGRDNPDHGPFSMSRLAAEVVRAQPPSDPLFLQLHYLPPHQPYDPGLQFDRFTDPAYAGTVRPEMSLKSYSLGLETLAGDDLAHLIGLYDGNLSRADAAVGQVLEALDSSGRLDDTLIVLTSDHGEAFMEHGRQGHNTTLFDEMLHVPLLIRLPGGRVPAAVDPDRLASVLDIVPTVLGHLGVEPRPVVEGWNLLDSTPPPVRPRMLFFRTSHPRNAVLAARTSRWKAIAWPRHQVQMLFDLQTDPQELDNLVAARPYLYAGMGLRIRQHLRRTGHGHGEGEPVTITEEAEEALRALGYLD